MFPFYFLGSPENPTTNLNPIIDHLLVVSTVSK